MTIKEWLRHEGHIDMQEMLTERVWRGEGDWSVDQKQFLSTVRNQ